MSDDHSFVIRWPKLAGGPDLGRLLLVGLVLLLTYGRYTEITYEQWNHLATGLLAGLGLASGPRRASKGGDDV